MLQQRTPDPREESHAQECPAGFIFAGMAVVSLVGVMPAAFVADHLGRKWTIVPSCLGLAAALALMSFTGKYCKSDFQQMITAAK